MSEVHIGKGLPKEYVIFGYDFLACKWKSNP